ncbi:hypothetical protein JD844_028793 [Phrynosoma platyrhinos]|uniref:Aftiphilin clathrin-binding box domain-containing protein n=1 Tax=Phrynosoma platyrhinos TaxID=52577 RepID=A0ABQ7SIF4_PHRPL|nr:hypothetical protein JD844_028793 [Phrynosoma platyrhinos]
MYSSSPPLLDNGADEEEEEEFGNFGGLSGAGSTSVGIDFISDYSGSKEEHIASYNSDYSGKVDNIIAFTTVHYTNDKEGITEFPSSVKGLSGSHKEKCECRDLNTSCDVIPAEIKRTGKPESPCPEIIRTNMKVPSQVQQVDSCNGETTIADFSSAGCGQSTEWNAFEAEQKESCLWATFENEQEVECHTGKDGWPSHRTGSTSDAEYSVSQMTCKSGSGQLQELPISAQTVLLNHLERIFEACFPYVSVSEMEAEIAPLNLLLEVGNEPGRTKEASSERELLDVWAELQDIHDGYGLKYQWGGTHSNKKLLCSLGINTRNILFTGNKKQPVIVPMYAAGLGMLEPTKEPLKPISSAEKIASIGQTPTVSPEMNMCTPDQFQESLPPVQFDWSSSGLTNPLDVVDPELYKLTTSKLETSNTTSKVTDAFAKLMSTAEKASSSAKKPNKEEQLSEEAAKVISRLPHLSFMHAKMLMFPP